MSNAQRRELCCILGFLKVPHPCTNGKLFQISCFPLTEGARSGELYRSPIPGELEFLLDFYQWE